VTAHRLDRVQVVPRPVEEVFAFFTDASNLETLTPDFVGFAIERLPERMAPGAILQYRLRLFGVPVRWRSRIDLFEPGRRFRDVQEDGPYRSWIHLHEFERVPEGTRVVDRVDYELPLGPLGDVAHVLFVRPTLERIFDFRRDRLEEIFGGTRAA
jgi:ligand-binding SRPBCC domain-containing protein